MRWVFAFSIVLGILFTSDIRAASPTEIHDLLEEYLDMSDEDELRLYRDNLKDLLGSELDEKVRARIHRRLGDVNHDLLNLRVAVRWYEKAQAVLPELRDPYKSFVPMRLKRMKNRIRRQNMVWAIYAVYVFILAAFVYRFFRSKGVDVKYLLTRGSIAVVGVLVLGLAVLMIDRALLEPCGDGPAFLGDVTKPVIQLPFFDVQPAGALWTGLGCLLLPIIVVILHCSLKRDLNRIMLAAQMLLLSFAGWSHFVLLYAYDVELSGLAIFSPTHVSFYGDVETELGLHPEKVMNAAKDFPDACSVFEQYIQDPAPSEGDDEEMGD